MLAVLCAAKPNKLNTQAGDHRERDEQNQSGQRAAA
jgi:hypothetical protein